METQQTQELKAERVQEEMVASTVKPLQIAVEEPFRISLKAERVQEPESLQAGGTVSLAYEVSFNQMRGVSIELIEPQIVLNLFATGGQAAA